jgi:hypothetical protein
MNRTFRIHEIQTGTTGLGRSVAQSGAALPECTTTCGVPSESRGAERLRFGRDRSFRRLLVRCGGRYRFGRTDVWHLALSYSQEAFEKSGRYPQIAERKEIGAFVAGSFERKQ